MSTAPPITIPAISIPKPSTGFIGFLKHVEKFFGVALKEFEIFAPPVAALASVLFPEVAAIPAAAAAAEQAAQLISNTVQLVQQKWASAPAGTETNAAKLADAVTLSASPAIAILNQAGVKTDTDRITAAINATVAILNARPAPAK